MARATDAVCPCVHRDDRPRTAADGLRVCRGCFDRLERAVAESPALYAACEAALASSTGATEERVTHRRDPGLVLSEAALRARGAIRAQLVATVRMVVEERGLSRWPADNVPSMATWLLAHVTWLAAHPAAEDWVAEWTGLRSTARSAAYPSGTRRVDLEGCPEPSCPGVLVAWLRRDGDTLPSVIACTDDSEHVWEPHEWQALGRRLAGSGHADLACRLRVG
jgi:hypothetical protein